MPTRKLPTPTETRATYQQGEAAVVALVNELNAIIRALETPVVKDSGNSSQPPSRDGLTRKQKGKTRERSGKRSGGQVGHTGQTLKAVVTPDAIVIHRVQVCHRCQTDLSTVAVSQLDQRQVFELPEVALTVTEHQAERKTCPWCGTCNRADFPTGVGQPTQYGPRFRAQLVYFHSGQFIPLQRTAEMVAGLYGQPVSEATILKAVGDAARTVAPVTQALKKYLVETPEAVHFDETGARVNGSLHWLHAAGTTQATLYTIHPKRGSLGIDAMGILNGRQGWSVHDGWKPYFKYAVRHVLCNAHHLRELTFIAEQYQHRWAVKLRHWLVHMKIAVDTARANGQSALSGEQLAWLTHRFDVILNDAQDEIGPAPPLTSARRPKNTPPANLLNRLRAGRACVLAFITDFTAPFDNNLAERDVRMVKVQQKVSGGFRRLVSAQAFCTVRSYLSTARKNGVSALDALTQAFAGVPFFPPCLSPTMAV
jgi:transposase